MTSCAYCDEPGVVWAGCKCCDDRFMVCREHGQELPQMDLPLNDKSNYEKYK